VTRSAAGGTDSIRRRAERLRVMVKSPGLSAGDHTNDCADFRQIVVLPTTDEVFATTPPFLPRASPDEPFLREDPEAQLLDRNFRLLREDFLLPLRESLRPGELTQHFLVRANGVEVHRKIGIPDVETGEVSVRVGSGCAGARLRFHPQHTGQVMKGLVESGRLRRGSLCLLLRPHGASSEPEPLAFARVVCAPELAKEGKHSIFRLSVAIDDLALLIGEPDWMHLYIVGSSFFTYAPSYQPQPTPLASNQYPTPSFLSVDYQPELTALALKVRCSAE